MFNDDVVALVGNGPVSQSYAALINSCPYVIRFNRYTSNPTYLSSWVGTKITHHILNVSEVNKVGDVHRGDPSVTRVVCVRPDRLHNGIRPYPEHRVPLLWLETFAPRLTARPTIGCMVLHWLLEVEKPRSIYMVGYSWSNRGMNAVHDLTEERRLFDRTDTSSVVELQ